MSIDQLSTQIDSLEKRVAKLEAIVQPIDGFNEVPSPISGAIEVPLAEPDQVAKSKASGKKRK